MEFFNGFASSIARDLVCGAVHQLHYPCCFNNLVEDLEKEKDNLIATINSVQDRVDHAKKQARRTAEVVDKWLKDANTLKDNVEELLEKARTKKSCCFGHCPNWIWRYPLGKKLAKKKGDVETCIKEGREYIQIERVASLSSSLPNISAENFLRFESRQSTYEELMEAVKDDEVSMIGLYGMGGCGKTTLAEELKKRAEAEHLYDKVLLVAVSSEVEIRRIQDKIASALQFIFPEDEERERAQRLCMRLTEEKRILVILDDVWEKLNFGVIGIPPRESHKGCKVLITTRSEDVCTLMDCQRQIHLSILTDDEAWSLFQKQAHISEGSPNTLKHLARQISDECKGLPVAIAAVAGTLKGKAEVDWKVALDRLRRSKPVNIERGLQNPYKCLQLSYDNLDSEEAKSLLLLCSVFAEDAEIPVEWLSRFAIALGLVGEVRSYEGARNEVCTARNKLINSCLLSNADEGRSVKMHDLVRDVAHWIARNEKQVIECALEKNVNVEDDSIRYLRCEKFPNQLDCSNLELLFLSVGTDFELSHEIFNGMAKLRVLGLINDSEERRQLSMISLKPLTNLRCLLLLSWELGDSSFLGEIKKLESLMLYGCEFVEIPDITKLTTLRLLDFLGSDMKRNPFEVIGRHRQLEELYIEVDRPEWGVYNVPQALKMFQITLGDSSDDYHYDRKLYNGLRTLHLSSFDTSNAAVTDLAKKAEDLFIADIQGGVKNIIPDIFQIERGGSMNELIELWIKDSENIECLVDASNHLSEVGTLFSELIKLTIESMKHFGALYHGSMSPSCGLFEKLEKLYVRQCAQLRGPLFDWKLNLCSLKKLVVSECPELMFVFTPAAARSLVQFEKLRISRCDGLMHILADGDTEETPTSSGGLFEKLEKLDVTACAQLRGPLFDCKLNLCSLKELVVSECPELMFVFTPAAARSLVQFEKLRISRCDGLMHILADDDTEETPTSSGGLFEKLEKLFVTECAQLHDPFFDCKLNLCSLKELAVRGCPELTSVFTPAAARSLVQLEGLTISGCDGLKHILADDGIEEISKEHQALVFRKLRHLTVEECNKLECTIPVTFAQGLLQLKSLTIEANGELKYVFGHCTRADQSQHELKIKLPVLKELTLDMLPNIISVYPENCYAAWPSLQTFDLRDCPKFDTMSIHTCMAGSDVGKECDLDTTKDSKVNGLEIIGQPLPVSLGLRSLELRGLPQMTYSCVGSKNSSTFQNLETLRMVRCVKLEVIFPASVLRCLPVLECLEIIECEELKQIIEEDLENTLSPQPCLPKLAVLLVKQCHKMKRLISASTSNDLPNLQVLVIREASELEEIIGCEQGQGDEIGVKTKVELPKLKLVILMQLSSLCQGIELQTAVRHCVVHNCPKLSLTSTATLQEFKEKLDDYQVIDLEIDEHRYTKWRLREWLSDTADTADENPTEKATTNFPVAPETQRASGSELPSSQVSTNQSMRANLTEYNRNDNGIKSGDSSIASVNLTEINENSKMDFVGKVPGSEIPAIATSPTVSELTEGPSTSPLDVPLHKTHSHELVDEQSMTGPCLMKQQGSPGETESTIAIPQCLRETKEQNIQDGSKSEKTATATLSSDSKTLDTSPGRLLVLSQMSINRGVEEQTTSGNAKLATSSTHSESASSRSGPVATSQHKSYQHSTEETETANVGKDLASVKPAIPTFDSEPMPSPTSLATPLHKIPSHKLVDQESTSELGFLDQQLMLVETMSTKDVVKESIQEGSTSEEAIKETLSTGVDKGISWGGGVVTHQESSSRDMLLQDSQIVEHGDKPNEGEIGAVSNDSSIGPPPDTHGNHSLIIAELEAFKQYVDLDDAQIALLVEAMTVYPHLWNVCDKFSKRFKAWMLKTLADMLLFLRNESADSVTPEQKNKFHGLCDEAVHLGFERSWVDKMRQRVMVKYPGVDHAQGELLKSQDQIT